MNIQLSDHFDYRRLLYFALPSIVMMIFTSIYGVVDGFFISNFVGESAFASVNLILPYCMVFSALGSLFGVGGSALIAKVRGEGDQERANRIFSMLVYTMIVVSIIVDILAELFLPTAAELLGAGEDLICNCILYGRILISTMPAFLLQYGFQSFMITAEKPKLGLAFTLAAGLSNMFLDWFFMAVLKLGVRGAAAATCMGQCIGGFGPLLYFIFKRDGSLVLGRPSFMPKELAKAASNGLADFITNVAMSAVNIVYNYQLIRMIGEYGVSAYGIIMYTNFIFVAVYLGYSMGTAPIVSYHYGAENYDELKNLFRKGITIILTASVVLTIAAELLAPVLAGIFAGYDPEFLKLSTLALRLYSLSYVFAGINIFGGSLFAALNNGKVSGMLSGLRVLVFQLAAVLVIPMILGSNGIWLSMLAAELCMIIVTIAVMVWKHSEYHYF